MELSENWGFRHLFDLRAGGGHPTYLTGEMGLVMYQDEAASTRVKTLIPFYDGSFYTMISTVNGGELIVAGMRGNAFRSADEGQTWQFLELPTQASVVGSTRLADGRIVLVTQAGQVLVGNTDNGTDFSDGSRWRGPYPLRQR